MLIDFLKIVNSMVLVFYNLDCINHTVVYSLNNLLVFGINVLETGHIVSIDTK